MVAIEFEFVSNSRLPHFFIFFLTIFMNIALTFAALDQSLDLALVRMCMELAIIWITKTINWWLSRQFTFVEQTRMVYTLINYVYINLFMHILLNMIINNLIWITNWLHFRWNNVRRTRHVTWHTHHHILFGYLTRGLVIIIYFNYLVLLTVLFVLINRW